MLLILKMNPTFFHIQRYALWGCLLLIFQAMVPVWSTNFVVVIDAGHGGHDPGAVGAISKEKNINLRVALKLGRLIEENCQDVNVVYTRKRDVFIPLARRAEIANEAKADLFISIHTNALPRNKTLQGTSTWTLGLAKSDANLEVAKRENAVILYESDYKTRYAGFNPNSSESYIIFEFMQDKYMQQSVHLASLIQQEFRHRGKRTDRGVHQAGFLVLKATAMPSVLVELGFISTPAEERFLSTDEGTTTLANSIYKAFLSYKKEHDSRRTDAIGTQVAEKRHPSPIQVQDTIDVPPTDNEELSATDTSEVSSVSQKVSDDPIFKIQILTSPRPLSKTDKRLQGLRNVEFYVENKTYKYTCEPSTDYNKVLSAKRKIASRFKDAFIIAFQGEKKVDVNKAITTFKNRRNK